MSRKYDNEEKQRLYRKKLNDVLGKSVKIALILEKNKEREEKFNGDFK